MSTPSPRLSPAEEVKTITVDDSLVLVDGRSGNYFGLNEVGARIWRLLEEGQDEAGITAAIRDEYDKDQDTIVSDLRRILSELADAGLVKQSTAFAPGAGP